MNHYPPIKTRPPIVQRTFRGINKLDAFSLRDDESSDMSNISSDKYPALSVRPGFSLLGTAMPAAINGLGAWKDNELHAVSNGVWYKWNGTTWISTGTTGLGTTDASFANFKGGFSDINLIMANGVGQMRAYDGSSVSTLATSPSGANYVEQFTDRLFAAVDNDLKYTAYRIANDWTTANGDDADSGYITIETSNGEKINGVNAGLSALTVFKPSSIHRLMGYAPSDYTLFTVTTEVGILNNKCVATVQGVMFILDDTGIYQYVGSTKPDKSFSFPVQWYVDNMNKSAANTCFLTSDGKKLYAAIPMTGSTPDTLLVYDLEFQIWYVWNDWSPTCGVKMQNELYLGDTGGKVIKLGGTADNGTGINWRWVSKPFGAGSLSQQIRWYRMRLILDVPAGSSLNIHVSKSASGDSDWVQIGTTITGSLKSVRIPLNMGALAMGNWLRVKFSGVGPCNIYEWDREQEAMPLR
jgi:hypothetical protein